MENEDIETISSLEQLKKVINQWSVWDLTCSGMLTIQSIYGDLIVGFLYTSLEVIMYTPFK